MMGKGPFSDFTQPSDMINSESVVNIKAGVSCVVIGYYIDNFTCIWFADHGLIGKVSASAQFPLK